MFKYLLFDLDMTLMDSIKGLTVGANMLAEKFGLAKKTHDDVHEAEKNCVGASFERLWAELWGRYDPAWYEAYTGEMSDAELAAMELFPDGRPVLEKLRALGVPMGVASNRDYPGRLLDLMGVSNFFDFAIGEFDVERSKPAPDMVFKGLELFGAASPDEMLYVGDSIGDVQACLSAGVKIFGVSTGGRSKDELMNLGCWMSGDSLSEVPPLFSGFKRG